MDATELGRSEGHERRLAEECFRQVSFEGDAHTQVYKRIRQLSWIANASAHYSPYAALVQSSGVGKTRCVMEMSALGVYVCYCSLAGATSSAYPPRTRFLADRLTSSFTELEMVLYFKAWLRVLGQAVGSGVSAKDWKEMQLPGTGDVAKSVLVEWERLIADTPEAAYMEQLRSRDRDLVNVSMLETEMQRLEQALTWDRTRVIFVFDEARGLHTLASAVAPPSTSPFCQVRRALRAFFTRRTFFALMLDTSAKVGNLLPRKSDEDSSRALKIGIQLLPAIYYLPTLELNVPTPGLSVKQYLLPATWMKYGRPLWAARMVREGQDEGTVRTKLLEFAKQKLMGTLIGEFKGQEVNVIDGIMTESQALALLSAVAGLQICPRSVLAETMAASHMNLVLRVADNRSRIFVAFPAEPILSEAAAGLLAPDIVKQKALMHMEAACLAGYVTAGPRGEFVAKFILVAAVWSYAEEKFSSWYLQPIPVDDFLGLLLLNISNKTDAATQKSFQTISNELPKGGIVFFNSFVVVGRVPDVALLGKCFAGGHAIMYQAENRMPGADVIVPVWTPRGMTCLVVSVKNLLSNPGWMEDVSLEAVQCEFTQVQVAGDLPVVTVVMSLQEPAVACPPAWLMWDQPDERYVQLACYGIENNYGYLSKAVKEVLKAILVTRVDPVKGADSAEQEWIRRMLPYQYQEANAGFGELKE